jgi:hypothetical protein
MPARDLTPDRISRAVPLVVMLLVGVALLIFAGSLQDDPLSPHDQRCQELRVSANSVTDREDTTADELEYLKRAEAADRACAGE